MARAVNGALSEVYSGAQKLERAPVATVKNFVTGWFAQGSHTWAETAATWGGDGATKLNELYGRDVTSAQRALEGLNSAWVLANAVGAGKVVGAGSKVLMGEATDALGAATDISAAAGRKVGKAAGKVQDWAGDVLHPKRYGHDLGAASAEADSEAGLSDVATAKANYAANKHIPWNDIVNKNTYQEGVKTFGESKYNQLLGEVSHNTKSDSLTLGRYLGNDPTSYDRMATTNNSMHYGMSADKYNTIKAQYSLTDDDMFRLFNEPAIDKAEAEGKVIRFSQNPDAPENRYTTLHDEWKYMQSKYGYNEVTPKGGFWYAHK